MLINMDPKASFDSEEVENVYSYEYDGSQAHSYEPTRCQRDQEQNRVRRNNGHSRDTELW